MKKHLYFILVCILLSEISLLAVPSIKFQPNSASYCPTYKGTLLSCTAYNATNYYWYKKRTRGFKSEAASYTPGDATYISGLNTYDLVGTGSTFSTGCPVFPLKCDNFEDGYAGTYICIASEGLLYVVSNAAILSESQVPVITTGVQDRTVCDGGNTSFSVTATGTGLTYQWTVDGDIQSDVDDYLSLSNITTSMDGTVRAKVTNSAGCYVYSYGYLTVASEVQITQENISPSVCEGDSVELSVLATGKDLNYQWKISSTIGGTALTNIDGATNSSYFYKADTADEGKNIRVYVYNVCPNDKYSSSSTISTLQPPLKADNISVSDSTVCAGASVTLSAIGGNPGEGGSWQWYKNSCEGITLGTGNSIETVVNTTTKYYVKPINSTCGTLPCDSVTVYVKEIPTITSYPQKEIRCEGDTVSFTIDVEGFDLSYSWSDPSMSPIGTNSNTLSMSSLAVADDGKYTVLIENGCGAMYNVVNDSAELTVAASLLIVNNLASDSLCTGQNASFGLTVNGAKPINYEWYKDGIAYDTTISSYLNFPDLKLSDSGAYYVKMTNNCVSVPVVSDTAKLYVSQSPSKPMLGNDTVICNGTEIFLDAVYSGMYSWNTGDDTKTISVSQQGNYYLQLSNDANCSVMSDTINIGLSETFNGESICMVTNDSSSGNNLVVWERSSTNNISHYMVLRESAIGNLEEIATVPYSNISVYEDTSSSVNPDVQTYKYALASIDTCGNVSDTSFWHRTIHLQISQGSPSGRNLSWSQYYTESNQFALGRSYYIIYKGIMPDQLDSVHSVAVDISRQELTWTDTDTAFAYYRIGVPSGNPCTPASFLKASSGPFSQSISNIEDNRLRSDEITNITSTVNNIEIVPNPIVNNAKLNFYLNKSGNVSYEISNILGSVIYSKNLGFLNVGNYSENLSSAELPKIRGVYMLSIILDGDVETIKFIKAE